MNKVSSFFPSVPFRAFVVARIKYALCTLLPLCIVEMGVARPGASTIMAEASLSGEQLTDTLVDVGAARKSQELTLEEALQLARDYSAQSLLAKHRFRASYWQYQSYKAEFLPSLQLAGNLPDFNKRLVRYQLADGSYQYISEYSNNMGLSLSANQRIGWTGTSIFATTSLERTDIFGERRSSEYMAVPLQIGVQQSIFGVNELKWKKRIEPLVYEEARRTYLTDLERISQEASDLFFECILSEQRLAMARLNRANADTLYKIALGRYNVGTIAENDVLQMELNYLNAMQSVNASEVELKLQQFRLVSYLGLNDSLDWHPVVPREFPIAEISLDAAQAHAETAHPDMIAYLRQEQEAKQRVAQAQEARGFAANLRASFGLTQRATTLPETYKDPLYQYGARLGITVPILDWGKGKGRVKMAQSNLEMTQTTIARTKMEFQQNLYVQVMRYNQQRDQLTLAAKADTIAQSRYYIAKQRFLIGKIDVLTLDDAQLARDNARTAYIRAMQSCWSVYFGLRRLTLFDPLSGKELKMELEALVK